MIPQIDLPTRYVARKDVTIAYKTLETASEEAADYEYSRISNAYGTTYYACEHGDAIHIIAETKDGEIGCSCGAHTFHCEGDEGCKHLAPLLKRDSMPSKTPSKAVLLALKAAGWKGLELRPPEGNVPEATTTGYAQEQAGYVNPPAETTSDPSGEEDTDLVPGEDPEHEPVPAPGLGETVHERICPHCDMRFEGGDADEVKERHRKHVKNCIAKPADVKAVEEQQHEATKMKELEQTTEIQTTEPQRGFLTAAVSLDDAIAAFDLYEQAKTRLLSDNDVMYIGAGGKPVHKDVEGAAPYLKKSAWRKMARFFGLSIDILGREKIWTEDANGESYYIWAYQIKVSHQCGAYVNAEGVCSSRDKFFTKGGKVVADEKNVMLKAQTVGINRGISDLLGAGEVSAEEVD